MVDSDLDGLDGPVRHVEVTQTCRVMRDGGEIVDRSVRTATRDRDGRTTGRTWTFPSGAASRTLYSYDSNGRLAETVEIGRNPDGREWTFRRAYTYDAAGRLVEERHESADGAVIRTRRPTYTADGRRIEEERFEPRRRGTCGTSMEAIGVDGSNVFFQAPTGARRGRIVYDARGAPESITFTGRMGLTAGKVLFETDAAGRIVAVRAFGAPEAFNMTVAAWLRPVAPLVAWAAHHALNGWSRWNLLRRGRWRTLARTCAWGPLWSETFTRYDEKGRRLEERQRFAAALETSETWTYDDHGRVVERRGLYSGGELESLEESTYETDARGNWVRRTIRRPRLPHSSEQMVDTTERAIEYYD